MAQRRSDRHMTVWRAGKTHAPDRWFAMPTRNLGYLDGLKVFPTWREAIDHAHKEATRPRATEVPC